MCPHQTCLAIIFGVCIGESMDDKVCSISMRVHTYHNNNLRNNNKQVKQARLIRLFKLVLDGEKNTFCASKVLDKPLKRT